jgi:hypothetical protein
MAKTLYKLWSKNNKYISIIDNEFISEYTNEVRYEYTPYSDDTKHFFGVFVDPELLHQ